MTQNATDDLVARARDAFAANEWTSAYELFAEADRAGDLTVADLITYADATWWTGRVDEAQRLYERAYSAALDRNDSGSAARAALWLAWASEKRTPITAGWISNARRLLKDLPECEEHGMLSYVDTNIAVAEGDLEGAYQHARRTEEIGSRVGSRNLLAMGLFDQGNVLIAQGKVDEGFSLLDEAMVAAVSGDLDPRVTGTIYCSMITTCTRLADYKRASEWTDAADRWCGRQSITVFPGLCRVYRAAIMRLRGVWDRAETEARLASEQIGDASIPALAEAFYEIGEIRLRVGDFDAAEQSFREAHQLGRDPIPGMALLRLHKGDIRDATAMINRGVAEQTWDRLSLAHLLPAQVEIALAAGDVTLAREAADALAAIVETYSSTALRASSACTAGLVTLAEGDAETALASVRAGLRLWQEVDAPYEAAQARLTLASVYQALGDDAAAGLELDAAAAAFEKLGARPDLLKARALSRQAQPEPVAGSREQRTFMFTDIVRSTDLMEAMGEDAWQDCLNWHDARLRSLFAEHAGEEVKHGGDDFFVAFRDPDSALDCAVAIQQALNDHRRSAGFAPQVRIGLHEGHATRRKDDYFGIGVNVAARIGAEAGAAEILTSCDTVAAAKKTIPTSDPRAVALKGISDPVEIVSVDWR